MEIVGLLTILAIVLFCLLDCALSPLDSKLTIAIACKLDSRIAI